MNTTTQSASSAGWNRTNAVGSKPAPKKPTVLRGALAGLAVVAAIVAVFIIFFSGEDAPVEKKVKKDGLIKEVTPVVVPVSDVSTNESGDVAQQTAKPVKKASKQPVGYQRVMTLMDGTVVTNTTKAIFKRPLENILAAAVMRPTGTGRTLLIATWKQYGDTAFLQMLREMTVPEEGDSDRVRQIKENVQATKEEILLEVAKGRSLESIFAEIAHDNSMDRMVNAQTIRTQSEAIRSGDAESVRQATETVNEIRRNRGLADLEVPQRFRQDDDWGMVPNDSAVEAEYGSVPESEADAQ